MVGLVDIYLTKFTTCDSVTCDKRLILPYARHLQSSPLQNDTVTNQPLLSFVSRLSLSIYDMICTCLTAFMSNCHLSLLSHYKNLNTEEKEQ